MEQEFSNLLGNAVQHGDLQFPIRGSLEVKDSSVIFIVQNYGEPVQEDILPFIFNPMGRFSQHASLDLGPSTGLGLGLYIASEIVAAHSGTIEVTSNRKRGTTFLVKVPVEK
ncbi:sensor histidine kinase [Pseudomonas svalbardensis]|uniref:sensor histidine kinase n=1 Tax=Pseudomonas svalbardensis TaxID=3042029 RepID=UPI0024B3388C|nr:ATP-binding protein [Pseudomonas sp. PMCC200367]